jgi:hypothetical protein
MEMNPSAFHWTKRSTEIKQLLSSIRPRSSMDRTRVSILPPSKIGFSYAEHNLGKTKTAVDILTFILTHSRWLHFGNTQTPLSTPLATPMKTAGS